MPTFIILLVVIGVLFYSLYSGIIRKKNKALEAFSGIDVQLKKRADLIPNILTLAKKFMEHEKNLLMEITELRTSVQKLSDAKDPSSVKKRLEIENQLSSKMGSFFVAVENYPQLKSDASIVQAQKTYNEVEEHISAARRFYNSAVTVLNNAVQIFPGNLVAGMLGIQAMTFFEADPADKKPVMVGDIL